MRYRIMIVMVTLVGAIFLASASANAAVLSSDVYCPAQADHLPAGAEWLRFTIGPHRFSGRLHLAGQTEPIQELGRDPTMVSAIRRFCRQRATATVVLTRNGHRIQRVVMSGSGNTTTGRLNVNRSFNRGIRKVDNDLYCVSMTARYRDKDQVISTIHRRRCGRTRVIRVVIRIR